VSGPIDELQLELELASLPRKRRNNCTRCRHHRALHDQQGCAACSCREFSGRRFEVIDLADYVDRLEAEKEK
jgi:hypothetical protein